MFFCPLLRAGIISGYLGIEDEKAGLKFSNMGADAVTVLLHQLATLRFRTDAFFPQSCISQHFPDRHPCRLQAIEERDPDQDRRIVITLAGLVSIGIRQQPDPLVVTDRMG